MYKDMNYHETAGSSSEKNNKNEGLGQISEDRILGRNKKILACIGVFIVALVLAMSVGVQSAFAAYSYSTKMLTNGTDGSLNLRSAATNSTVTGVYRNGTIVMAAVSAKTNNYVPVQIGTVTGWMYYPYLQAVAFSYSTLLYTNGTDGTLNLRNAPANSSVIGIYNNDTAVYADVSAKSNDYVPVQIGSVTGWMYYPYLKATSSVATGYNYSTKLLTNGTDGSLNLRNAATNSKVIGVYSNGTEVMADTAKITNNYVPVKIGSVTGWMYYPYLKTPPAQATPTSPYTTTMYTNGTDGSLNLRSAATNSYVIRAYPNGTPVLINPNSKVNNYVAVQIDTVTGWMYYPYLTNVAPQPKPPSGSRGAQIVAVAKQQLGKPYHWGSKGQCPLDQAYGATNHYGPYPQCFDCSGLSSYAYKQIGISIPAGSANQWSAPGLVISKSDLLPGDLVLWTGHVAIYSGNGNVVEAYQTGKPIRETTLQNKITYSGNPLGYKRYW